MNITAIIQARMSSTRLPGKVLLPLLGKPALEHVVRRVQSCRLIHNVVVATSTDTSDDKISEWCLRNRVSYFRGSLTDVLDRYHQSARQFDADVIVRITADCPVIDPATVDEVVMGFLGGDYDLYSLIGEFPDGLDCQVFSRNALARAWREAVKSSDREHVGSYIEETRPEQFKIGGLRKFEGLSNYRWTLDEAQDYVFLEKIFDRLGRKNPLFSASDILAAVKSEPRLLQINRNITRNAGYLRSIREEL